MMKRTLFFFVTALSALTCIVLAGEFWENKAYQDWTDKDVEKLLKKSPWSQRVTLYMGGSGGGGGMPPGGGGGRGGGGRGGAEMGQEMNFTVRWDSALPIRQAALRAHYGPEVDTIEGVRKALNTKGKPLRSQPDRVPGPNGPAKPVSFCVSGVERRTQAKKPGPHRG